MGWIGVDLFFVLSGFLVSGLLFKEYIKYGNIQIKNFLIRRGFKIYPIYYMFYLPYLILLVLTGRFDVIKVSGDITFTQNYVNGYGFAFPASWSLAVEEHFYFGLAIIFRGVLKYRIKVNPLLFTVSTMCLCFLCRLTFQSIYPSKAITLTHLRIDSLLAGVFVAYLYYFKLDTLKSVFFKYKYVFYCIAFAGLSWTPFTHLDSSEFAKTIGFTLIYLSFSIVLVTFILTLKINEFLNKAFSKRIADLISEIGVCSYSIYIIHTLIFLSVHRLGINNEFVNLIIFFTLSISVGRAMTFFIENYFLRIRSRYYPGRADVKIKLVAYE